MSRVLCLLLVAFLIVAGCARPVHPIETPDCAYFLLDVDARLTGILDDQGGIPADLTGAEALAYYNRSWRRLQVLRADLLNFFLAPECEAERQALLEAVEEHQRENELIQAYIESKDQEFRLRAYDARRRADIARHRAWAGLFRFPSLRPTPPQDSDG